MTLLWSDMTADSLFVFEGLEIFGRSESDCQNQFLRVGSVAVAPALPSCAVRRIHMGV